MTHKAIKVNNEKERESPEGEREEGERERGGGGVNYPVIAYT